MPRRSATERCPNQSRAVLTRSEHDPTIASERSALTTRAAKWTTRQVGKHGRAMSEVTDDLACDWHTVMGSVVLFGQVLIDDPIRYATVAAIGSDEALCKREGWRRKQRWSTQIVDVEHDPLYGCRRRLVMPRERLTVGGHERVVEICRLGGTITKWAPQIVAWHRARVTSGPTEATSNLIKRVKRTAFELRRFKH